MDFWGIPTPDPLYIQSPAKLQVHSSHLLNPLGLTATAGETQAHRDIWAMGLCRGRSPSFWGVPAGSVLSKRKHRLRDSTSADLVTGLRAGPSEGGGCPLRREDGTRGPLCQQLLRHLFSTPAFRGHPPPSLRAALFILKCWHWWPDPCMGLHSPCQHLPGPGSPAAPVKHNLPS